MTQPPQHVMRFYGSIQYAIECIALKQITFLHRDKLNDPFDSYYHFETDFNDDYQTLIDHVLQHHPEYLQDFIQRLPKENWDSFIITIEEDYFRNLRNNIFIFSTSAVCGDRYPKDNLYMWSHYGNGHRGVAIEFDAPLLDRAFLEKQKSFVSSNINENAVWSEIYYKDDLPEITCEHIFQFVMNDKEIPDEKAWDKRELTNTLRQRFSSKSIEWRIEKEWRLMWHNDETKLKILRLDLLDETITAVYFGCRISDNNKDDIIFETNRNFPKAEIFRAIKTKGKFALDFEQIAGPANSNLAENRKQKTENQHAKNS